MWREARARGANAIVAMHLDCNEIEGIMSEVTAYGAAGTVQPIREGSVLLAPDPNWPLPTPIDVIENKPSLMAA